MLAHQALGQCCKHFYKGMGRLGPGSRKEEGDEHGRFFSMVQYWLLWWIGVLHVDGSSKRTFYNDAPTWDNTATRECDCGLRHLCITAVTSHCMVHHTLYDCTGVTLYRGSAGCAGVCCPVWLVSSVECHNLLLSLYTIKAPYNVRRDSASEASYTPQSHNSLAASSLSTWSTGAVCL